MYRAVSFGSEAKGAIAGYICKKDKIDYAVRTGATNAGHTVHYRTAPDLNQPGVGGIEVPVKLQQLPVGFVNPDTRLVIGAGALIDPTILRRECDLLTKLTGHDIHDRLYVDYRAGVHLPAHALRSRDSDRHHRIGATGKGCSEALIDRIKDRGSGYKTFGQIPQAMHYQVCDTEEMLNNAYNEDAKILLEGTQGQLLDLYLGPYPYTTHKQTGPAQWMLEAGLSPSLPANIIMVVRTFPIRVAGNSGPLPNEISWVNFAHELNNYRDLDGLPPLVARESLDVLEHALREAATKFHIPEWSDGTDQYRWSASEREKFKVAASELASAAWETLTPAIRKDLLNLLEMTTVTKKLRRIARISHQDLWRSSRQIRPASVALTFMNYVNPADWFKVPRYHSPVATSFIHQVEHICRAPVGLVSYGPSDEHIVDAR